MNKEQALAKIDELKQFIENCDKEEERIRIPDCIKFEEAGDGDGRGIIYNDGKQYLCFTGTHGGIYCINFSGDFEDKEACIITKPQYLIPVKRENLKPGDTAFRSDEEKPDFEEKSLYCKIIDCRKHTYIELDRDILVSQAGRKYRRKVVD